jgi:hypothetical protein
MAHDETGRPIGISAFLGLGRTILAAPFELTGGVSTGIGRLLTDSSSRRKQIDILATGSGLVSEAPSERSPAEPQVSRGLVGTKVTMATASHPWSTPIDKRPSLLFGRGDMAAIFDIVGEVRGHSPAAAIALMDFVCVHSSGEYQIPARAGLTAFLMEIGPTLMAARSVEAGIIEARDQLSRGAQLTAQLSACELEFLKLIELESFNGDSELRRLEQQIEVLYDTAEKLILQSSQWRQASARIILADLLARSRRYEEANNQLARALVLLGTVLENTSLIDLAKIADGGIVEKTRVGIDPPPQGPSD